MIFYFFYLKGKFRGWAPVCAQSPFYRILGTKNQVFTNDKDLVFRSCDLRPLPGENKENKIKKGVSKIITLS